MTTCILFLVGLGLLIGGAEALVRGAARWAHLFGVSPLIIGLTVVAFGTSAPELAVSIQAGLAGQADLAVGNVVGSNILNVLLILGVSALITPLIVSRQVVRLDVPIMIGVSFLLFVSGLDGTISGLEGSLFCVGLVVYLVFTMDQSRRENSPPPDQTINNPQQAVPPWLVNGGLVGGGCAMLVLGAEWFVEGAVAIAQAIGVSELVIGLTIVAAGTSLPEVATSVMASLHGERDLAVGNVVGSNIFNILAVLGLSSLVTPGGLAVADSALHFDIPVMIAVALACLPIFFTGSMISRSEGILFLAYYAAYTLYLILHFTHHARLHLFNTMMLVFVIPITLVTLITLTLRSIMARHSHKQ